MLERKKTSIGQTPPIWQGKNVPQTKQGGFAFDTAQIPLGSNIPGGTPVSVNEATRIASILKVGKIQTAATISDVAYKVYKGTTFKVGEYFAAVVGGKAYAITAIDTSNALYDLITVGTTLAVVLNVDDTVWQSSATGAAAAALMVTPNGLTYCEIYDIKGNDSVSVVDHGVVYARRVGVPAAVRTLLSPSIIFSESF